MTLKSILRSMLKLRNHDTKLELRNYHVTIALQLLFLLDISPIKYILIFININIALFVAW